MVVDQLYKAMLNLRLRIQSEQEKLDQLGSEVHMGPASVAAASEKRVHIAEYVGGG